MSFIEFVQSRIVRGAMKPVALHRANSIARRMPCHSRQALCSPRPETDQAALPYTAAPDAKLTVELIELRDAGAFVNIHHRHHSSPVGHLFSLGCFVDGTLVGCAIVGRPVSRHLDDGKTVEITRLATAGIRNTASKLLGAARKAAAKRGYRRIITYTLACEGGASLRAAGYQIDGPAGGGSWSRPSRRRDDRHPTETKLRWSARC